MPIKVYAYQNCSTCRKAIKHLEAAGVEHEVLPIREKTPAKKDLKAALKQVDKPNKVFNTSGKDYKAEGLKDQLPGMSETDMVNLLSSNGNLIKRPFVVTDNGIVIGYKQDEWNELF